MYKRILIPLDGSQLAEQALVEGRRVALPGSEVVLLQIIRLPLPVMTPDVGMHVPIIDIDELEAEAKEYLDGFAAKLNAEGFIATSVVVESDNIAEAIVNYAREHQIELIVQSTHGRGGISRLLFGSVAEAVLRHAPCPVLLVRMADAH